MKQLAPGQTLYLRSGTHYETVMMAVSGTAAKPITIRSYPGELAIIDGGYREFYERPAECWEPFGGGGMWEYRSAKLRQSKTFVGSKDRYPPGWGANAIAPGSGELPGPG